MADVEYPINFYKKIVIDVSTGTADSYTYLLTHMDRATVTSATFYDHSTYAVPLYSGGNANVYQSTADRYFGVSAGYFSGSTSSVEPGRIVWTLGTALAGLTDFTVECFVKFVNLDTALTYGWWELNNDAASHYARHSFSYFSAGTASWYVGAGWYVSALWWESALGYYLSWSWPVTVTTAWTYLTMQLTASKMKFYVDGVAIATGTQPQTNFAIAQGPRFTIGGYLHSLSTSIRYGAFSGYIDEFRFSFGTTRYMTGTAAANTFSVPTAPFIPTDGSSVITGKTMSLYSTYLGPATDGGISLGATGTQWNDAWITGKAYVDGLGESILIDSVAQVQFRDTSTYIYSSSSGNVTLVSTNSFDVQSNLRLAAKNLVTDTATGTKVATATNEKLGFFNATPIVQPAGGSLWNIRNNLKDLGLIASAGTYIDVATIATTSTTYTLGTGDSVLICNSATAFTVNLPAAAGSGKEYVIKNIGSALVTLDGDSADTIDGSLTLGVKQWEAMHVLDTVAVSSSTAFDSYTVSMLHCDGNDGDVTFVDEIGGSVTTYGGAQVDNTSKFGTGALYVDGTGDYLILAHSTVFNFGTGDWTVDFWVYRIGNQMDFGGLICGSSGFGWESHFGYAAGGLTNKVRFVYAQSFTINGSSVIADQTWAHVAIVRYGTNVRIYVNGTVDGTATCSAAQTFDSSSTGVAVGRLRTGTNGYYFKGNLDEIRISKGTARWTTTFTVPTAAYSGGAYVAGGWHII